MQETKRPANSAAGMTLAVVISAYIMFVLLGIPDGMLGVAWPSMRTNFSVAQSQMGILLLASTMGFMLTSFAVGRLIGRFGIVALLMAACVVRGAGLMGMAFAPSWWALVSLAFCFGVGSGGIDAGMNTYFAMNLSPRLMNWLHASFGLGATLGPILLTALLSAGLAWRWGYALVGLAQMGLALMVFARARDWRAIPQAKETSETRAVVHRSYRATLLRPIVWVNIALFFSCAGLEATAGNWAFSLFTETRGVSVAVAGFWTSFYWASFTVGRLFFGFIADRINMINALRTVMVTAIVATLLLWWNPANWVGFAGLAILGFAMAPIFPLLISATPLRLGLADATNAIGFQVAAAAFGIAVLPGLAGLLAEQTSLEALGPYMVAIAIVMTMLHEIAVRGRTE